ncbi:MAG: transketolase family protein [Chloroflexota bacterium]|nr:transketolase family protein [Chloroflexota bacterium]MDP9469369.1 transketolase family protein [Chloroflexota bacterium]
MIDATTLVSTTSTGQPVAMREAWGQGLVDLAHQYFDLLVLDGDLANSTRADIFAAAYPDRFLEMGIAEQNMIGVAAGLATVGYVPWISTFAAFLAKRALDQIRVVVAQPGLNVKLCGSYSGILTSKTGKTHQAVQDLAVFRSMPGVVTIAPADAVELRGAMAAMMEMTEPVYLRLTRDPSPTIFPPDHHFQIGRAVLLRGGRDIGLIGTGVQTVRVLEAAELLRAEGVDAAVLHLPTLKPLDLGAIVQVAAQTGAIVTAEDHSVLGGLGSAVAETLAEHRPTPMRRIGWRDTYGESGPNDALLEKYGLTPGHIAAAARELLQALR